MHLHLWSFQERRQRNAPSHNKLLLGVLGDVPPVDCVTLPGCDHSGKNRAEGCQGKLHESVLQDHGRR